LSELRQKGPSRRLGDYYRSGDWSDYWTTGVSYVGEGKLTIRGYPVEELIQNLTFAEVLYVTIRGELPTKAQARVLDAIISSIPSHQYVAAHLLSATTVASAFPESPIPAIATGILTAGSNTVSPQEVAHLVERGLEIKEEGGLSFDEAAERLLDEYLAAGRFVPGLGHPNHKEHDMRATEVARVAKAEGIWGDGCELYASVHRAFNERTGKNLPINIDGMMGPILRELGFTATEMPGIAAVGVMPGIIAMVAEEIARGVPLRIVPDPVSRYDGPAERHLPEGYGRYADDE
jgi:citrate synthase